MTVLPYRTAPAATLILCFVLVVLTGCSRGPEPGSPEYFAEVIPASLARLAVDTSSADLDSLRLWPRDRVFPAILSALEGDPAYASSDIGRINLYRLLIEMKAHESEEGIEGLIPGLIWPPTMATAVARELERVDEMHQQQVIDAMLLALQVDSTEYSAKVQMLRTLGQWRVASEVANQVHADLFTSPAEHEDVRQLALTNLIMTGDIRDALPKVTNPALDSFGVRAAVHSLEVVGGRTKGTFNTDTSARDQIREWVIAQMLHPSPIIRDNATRALDGVYGPDWYPMGPDSIHRINPDVITAIKARMEVEDEDKRRLLENELASFRMNEEKQIEALKQRRDSARRAGGG